MRLHERLVIRRCVSALLKAGYSISVNDGEETTLRRSRSWVAIRNALDTTDEDYLLIHRAEERREIERRRIDPAVVDDLFATLHAILAEEY